MPNKLNTVNQWYLFLTGVLYLFLSYIISLDFGKSVNPIRGYGRDTLIPLKFVWRQSGFAFFGALTSVGALFYFMRK